MRKAFTLVELLVVIGILGILMGVLVATFGGSTESARAAKCQSNMRNLAMGVMSVGMGSGYYPYAGSFDQRKKKVKEGCFQATGWISWSSLGTGGTYISPYDTDLEARELSLTNGSVWASMKGARDAYVCPNHIRYAKDKSMNAPLWSYVMNAYFEWGSNKNPRSNSHTGRNYRGFKRADRHLLFAELPYAKTKTASQETLQEGHSSSGATVENDPILQYSGCDGDGDEAIGFNHLDGKVPVAHVCFADGHVEKLRAPKDFTASEAKDLTKWLCRPVDDSGNDFDVSFDGKRYSKIQ